jgi:hypothetical protein
MAITPHPLIGFASEYMCWKALLRGFPLDGVLSTTTHDTSQISQVWTVSGSEEALAPRKEVLGAQPA